MEERTRFSIGYYLFVLAMILGIQTLFFTGHEVQDKSYSDFIQDVSSKKVEEVVITPERLYGLMKSSEEQAGGDQVDEKVDPPAKHTPWRLPGAERISAWFDGAEKKMAAQRAEAARHFTVIRVEDEDLVERLSEHDVQFEGKIESRWLRNLFFNWIIPFAILMLIWVFLMRRMRGGPNALAVGQNKAKIVELDADSRVSFDDVAGLDEPIEETRELVSFLKEPDRFKQLGGRLPRGVLLAGPPGTGKTLLAKAVAGEAGVPFYSISGSDFVEMFVGVGAARVRDLFAEARKKAPCIIFIDELDAIGKARGQMGPMAGGHDERENTLNQLLVEMDGFDARTSVIILAATNRPEVLDPALLRAGRFDRQIICDRPDLRGREAIFKVHLRGMPLGPKVDAGALASRTPGFVGADIANLCNEAALLASRRGHSTIQMDDFNESVERIVAGLERKSRIISDKERKIVAYHESGHALIGHFTPSADPVQKVSIIPRGRAALGYTLQTPLEDRYLMSRDELLGRVRVLLGGRAAEEVVFGSVSTGASDDLEKASGIVRQMLSVYGMSEKLPNLSLADSSAGGYLGQGPQLAPHSGGIAQALDDELMEILGASYEHDLKFLREHQDQLEKMAQRLLETETLDASDVTDILGPAPSEGLP